MEEISIKAKSEIDNFNKRYCFKEIIKNIEDTKLEKVIALYGLRRTGKTTLLKQVAREYGLDCIYQTTSNDTMQDVFNKLDELYKKGQKIVIIDEITEVSDFNAESAILADEYTDKGMKIIVTGTNSLGLFIEFDSGLLDRSIRIKTTDILFNEHCDVLNTKDVDDYIQYGGLMHKEYIDEMKNGEEDVKNYLDSSVAKNIAHSIKKATSRPEFSEIKKYCEEDLVTIIIKLVELYNGTMDADSLNAELKSVSITAPIKDVIKKIRKNNLIVDETIEDEATTFSNIDKNALREHYKNVINLNCNLERPATTLLMEQLEQTLFMIDFLSIFERRDYNKINGVWSSTKGFEYYIIQPAIKYALFEKGQEILLNGEETNSLTEIQKSWLSKQFQNDIFGRMTENIVIYNTLKLLDSNKYLVCKPYFRINNERKGEYDMLIYDKTENGYYAFEVKHSSESCFDYDEKGIYIGQDKNLKNQELREVIDANYGNRKNISVLYNGDSFIALGSGGTDEKVYFFNISDFLVSISKFKNLDLTFEKLSKDIPQKNIEKENQQNTHTPPPSSGLGQVSESIASAIQKKKQNIKGLKSSVEEIISKEKARVQYSFEHIVKQIEHSFGLSR